eukprot:Rhum_TRINITY_DN15916_c0_g1::Rhum_TRINITY_DN15916_c0_g1_i1::g.162438::m.162438
MYGYGSAPSSGGGLSTLGAVAVPTPQYHMNTQQYAGSHYKRTQQETHTVDSVNQDMIAAKRRRELEQAIADKENTLVTYRRNRVDVHDAAILERHIAALRQQLASIPQPVNARHPEGAGTPMQQAYAGTPVQAALPPSSGVLSTPASSTPLSTLGSGPGGRRTKRDDVWEKKYNAYLQRVASSRAGSVASTPIGHPAYAAVTPQQAQQQQQQQQQ